MFSSINWEIFITTCALLIGGYYFISTLLLFHKEIIHWVKSRGQSAVESEFSNGDCETRVDMMGGVRKESFHDLRSSNTSAEEIDVVSDAEEPESISSPAQMHPDSLLIGSVSDLLQEIKTVVQLVAECKSDRNESTSLFRTLLLRYPHLRSSNYQEVVSQYILDTAKPEVPFELSMEEIRTWWHEEFKSKS
jgi:hypothetical protein